MAVPPRTAPGDNIRDMKRAAEENSSSEEPTPKRGFIGRTLDRARNVLSSSSSKDSEASTSDAAPSPPAQLTTGGPPPMPPPIPPVTALETALPVPTNPTEYAAFIARYVDAMAAQRTEAKEEAEFKDPGRKLDFNMNINQHDKAWMDTRQEFINLLKDENSTPMAIFKEKLDEVQILYLMPPEDDGIILAVQKEHIEEYKDALGPKGRFRGVADNLATKLTMLHFGLPIEPVTLKNVQNCGKVDEDGNDIDISDKADDPQEAPTIQRIIWAEKPLEFLDKYGDGRSYGFPKLRIAKRRDLARPRTAPVPTANAPAATKPPSRKEGGEVPAPEPTIKGPPAAQPPSKIEGREAPVSAVPGTTSTPTGNGVETTPILATPVVDLGMAPRPRRGRHGGGQQQPHCQERRINPGRITVSIRGGAGAPEDLDTERAPPLTHVKYIYGYYGKIYAENNESSFLKTALRLLEYDLKKSPRFKFLVDIYSHGLNSEPDDTFAITDLNYTERFRTHIKQTLDVKSDKMRAIFVRTNNSAPPETQIQPDSGMKDIIRLNLAGNTSYWKIPRDLFHSEVFSKKAPVDANKAPYGINQCQPAFFRAMKLLFDARSPRPRGSVSLKAGKESWGLGFGGMEATVFLWRYVCEQANLLGPNTPTVLEFSVIIGEVKLPINQIGAHLMGSHRETYASFFKQDDTYTQIGNMSKEHLQEKKTPESIRIWHTAEEREQDVRSTVINLKKKSAALNSLQSYLEGWQGRTQCIWWRPEFGIFNVEYVGNKKEAQWDTQHGGQSLSDFKKSTKTLSADGNEFESFILLEAQSADNARRFVVTKDTTDDEWRMHIYDWLHSKKLFIKEIEETDPIPYVLDKESAFGVSDPITVSAPAPRRTPSTTSAPPTTTAPPNTTSQPAIINPFGTTTNTRMNKERIVAAAAGKPKSQTWSDWMTEQHFQDGLQRKSWIRDQSVVEPGSMPAAPLFGPSRELQLRVGSSMPTIYAQRLTPTDIKQLQDENQKLRNQVLDRMFACPICNEEFETYEKDEIRDHVKQHQTQLEEAGQCPSCGDPQWAFMTNYEKRTHFATHQYHNESAKIKEFYHDQHCPVCDRDLSKLTPEQVIRHCLEHAPGQVQYCDRCGLDEKDCNAEELRHHHHKCRLAKDRYPFEPEPVFCRNCGLDITRVTPEENLKHLKNCREGPMGRFCVKCGLNMTMHHWNQSAIDRHDSHCMPPSGLKKKFCEKCRTEIASLDAIGRSHHQQTCRRVEPAVPSERVRIEELKQRQDIAQQMDARLNSRKAYIEGRDRELNAREAALAADEKRVVDQETVLNDLRLQVDKLKRAHGDGYTALGDTDSDIPDCPIRQCGTSISNMTKATFVNHIESHTDDDKAPPFLCPLENANGDRCNHGIRLANDGFDLTVHYAHKLSDEDQATVTKTVSGIKGDFARLREKILEAKPRQKSDADFISQRSNLLDQTAVPSSSRDPITATTQPAADHARHAAPVTSTTTAATDSPTKRGTRGQGPAPPGLESLSWAIDKDEDEYSSKAKAARGKAAEDRAEAAKLTRLVKDTVEDPEVAKLRKDMDVDSALTRAGAAQKGRAAALLAARRRRPSVSQAGYKDLEEDSTSVEDSEEIEPPPAPMPKKKGRPTGASPVKATSVTSKKRKQAEAEEEVQVNKRGKVSGVSPVKKKQKKVDESVVVQTPKKAGRPKAKEDEVVVTARATRTPLKRVTRSLAKK